MKKHLLSCLLICALSVLRGQDNQGLQPDGVIKGNFIDFTVDNLGNIFLLDSNNQLKKLSPQGDSIAVFNDIRRYGKLYSIDAGNPLKILLFYRDFGTIVILDRLLNQRASIDLRKLNIFQVKAIGQSFDNAVWVYDENEARLKRIGDEGNLIDQTGDLRLQLEDAPSPGVIEDHDRLVYLYDSSKGVFIFDYFGALKNKLAFQGWQDFQLAGKFMLGRKAGMLERYQLGTLTPEEKTVTAVRDAVKVRIAGNRLFCLRSDGLWIYRF